MASVADFTLTALIKADASGFRAGIQDAKGALESLQSSSGNKLQKISDSFVGVGKALTAGLTLPLAAVGGASLKAFSEYDTALIGVRKTTDISGDALKRFSKQIMRLSREMPNSAVEIANLAEVAGQLGIRTDEGGKHLINFSKIAAQMGTATNMSSEQAANAMARLANITQMPQTQFHRLGSTIVALGNNLATTESEIADMSLRLAGTGHQIGLTEAQIAGLAAGMSSVGINAEAGGSAFSRVMQKMNTDVLSGGEGLQRFAAVAGKTAEEFAQTWRTNPQEAIVDFVKGLGKVKESGGDVTETLKDLGINSIREIDTLARLAGAGDLLAKSFGIANKAWADGTALQKEADAASESFANQLKKLKNALFEAGTVIGGQLAPHVGKLAEDIRKVVQAFNDLDPKVQANIVNFGLFLAKIGPAIYIVGKIIGMISKISLAISFISKLATAFKAAGGAIAGFKAIIALTGGPIAWIIAAIMALVGVITYLWTTNEGFRNAITGIWEAIKQVFSTAWEFIQSVWSAAPEFFSGIWEQIISTATPMWEEFVNSMGPLVEAFKNLWNSVVDFFVVLGEQIKPIWEDIKQFFSDTWGIIRGIFELALALLAPIVQVGFEVIQTIISTVWELIKIIIQTAWTIITTIISTAINIVADILRTVTAIIQGDWQGAWDAIKSIAETLWNAILTIGQTLFNALKSAIENILNAIQSIWSAVWNAVSSVTSSIWNAIVSIISNAMSTMQNAVSNGINAVKNFITNGWNSVVGFLRGINLFSAGSAIMQSFLSGLKSMWGAITSFVGGIASWIKSHKGPISYDRRLLIPAGKAIMGGFNRALIKGFEYVKSNVSGMAGKISDLVGAGSVFDTDMRSTISGAVTAGVEVDLGHQAKPLKVVLELGNRAYELFVDDITDKQQTTAKLREVY
ncbi:phage tail tape measure protein [Streptococcus pyogenes]|nr:phage tail tape measure protein [Streptococcus pyogenes]EZM06761.1 phage tail tape measure protein, TP901 family, core region [Streptococcus pyogenes ABC020041424]HER4636096.1 phage tail tape measure protein [Streptococcus pyogenes NGAS510]HER4811628.1 phage tail tape measure protein [Streptococcus pyogenes NGAS075]ARV01473.1 phage tail tape measure protein [Streptococcus pyogenes]UEN79754.1 phage tail tape measure protein [Streptococcus pyogenes]